MEKLKSFGIALGIMSGISIVIYFIVCVIMFFINLATSNHITNTQIGAFIIAFIIGLAITWYVVDKKEEK